MPKSRAQKRNPLRSLLKRVRRSNLHPEVGRVTKSSRKATRSPAKEAETSRAVASSYKRLARKAEQQRRLFERQNEEILRKLRTIDKEVVSRARDVFDSRRDAAEWMTTHNRALAGATPLEALAKGERNAVLDVLGRIEYGVYS